MHMYEINNKTVCPDSNDINNRHNVNNGNCDNYFHRRIQEIQSPSLLCEPPQLLLSSMSRMSSMCGCASNTINNYNKNNTTTNNITNTTTTSGSSSSMCGLSPSPVQTNAHILSYVVYSRPPSLCMNSPYQSNSPYPNLFFNKQDMENNNNNNRTNEIIVNSLNNTGAGECVPADIEGNKKINTTWKKEHRTHSPHTHFNYESKHSGKLQHVNKAVSREICQHKLLNTMSSNNHQSTMWNEAKNNFTEVQEQETEREEEQHQQHTFSQYEQQCNSPLYSRVNVFDNDVNAEIDVQKHFKLNSYKNVADCEIVNDEKYNKKEEYKHHHHHHKHHHHHHHRHERYQAEQEENYDFCINKEEEKNTKCPPFGSAVLDQIYKEPETLPLTQPVANANINNIITDNISQKINSNNNGSSTLHKPIRQEVHVKHNFSSRCGVTVEPISHFTHTRQGPFCCGKLLGRGGYAEVYEFTNVTSHMCYACKVVERSKLNHKSERDFWQEVHIHRSLHHQHIVELIDCCSDDFYYYVLLERCRSKTLMDVAAERHTLREEEARQIMVQLLDGVAYLHACRIVHCDIKLSNILFDYGGMVKIADFGFAYSLTNSNTSIRRICGTPNYIAPEVLQCRHSTCGYSAKVDVWSLGVVLFILVCGYAPFQSHNLNATYNRIMNNEYYFPCEMRLDCIDNDDDITTEKNEKCSCSCKYGCTNSKYGISASCKALIKQLLQQDPSMRPTIEEIQTSQFMSLPSGLSLSSTSHINTSNKCENTKQCMVCNSVAFTHLMEKDKRSAVTKYKTEEKQCCSEKDLYWQHKASKCKNCEKEKVELNKCNHNANVINCTQNTKMHTSPHCVDTEKYYFDKNDIINDNSKVNANSKDIYESISYGNNASIATQKYNKHFPSESSAYKINEEEQRQIAERVNMLLKGWITRQDVFAACKTLVREH